MFYFLIFFFLNVKGRRVKRDFNPFEVLHNLPGALVNKYSLQSTAKPTTKNINSPYYNQPITAGISVKQFILILPQTCFLYRSNYNSFIHRSTTDSRLFYKSTSNRKYNKATTDVQ